MLTEQLKQTIQSAYKQILENKGLKARYGQRLMIAEIAKTLTAVEINDDGTRVSDAPIAVIEAGTGTGKTIAYMIATIPIAQALKKKVVFATATVALQEQIIFKDLPDIKNNSGLDFSFSLAKGRGRYLCLSKLDRILQDSHSQSAMLDFYGEGVGDIDEENRALYQEMLQALGDGSRQGGRWEGDRDSWQGTISDENWRQVSIDHGQCMGSRCSNFSNCCFYSAREQVHKSDCIVANHDLVLADLALGGGIILPHPSDTIYIFDEAHHLPIKGTHHFSYFTRLRASTKWLQQVDNTCSKFTGEVLTGEVSKGVGGKGGGVPDEVASLIKLLHKVSNQANELAPVLQETYELLEPIAESGQPKPYIKIIAQTVFPLGVVPDGVRELAVTLRILFTKLSDLLTKISEELKSAMEGNYAQISNQQAENWYPIFAALYSRANANVMLWQNFSIVDAKDEAPCARWLNLSDSSGELDVTVSSSPVLAAKVLADTLWAECFAAVLTSATLSALGNFDFLSMRTGLPASSSHFVKIPSPFNYQQVARLVVPKMNCDPTNAERHTNAIVTILPQILDLDKATLVLFSSRRQMNDVIEQLPATLSDLILSQDDYGKNQLLQLHRSRIDEGKGSVIFGLASFTEGVDLPGHYCSHVVIAKIPFSVPNDPVESTLAHWVEKSGRNAFMEISVPEASLRLIQASGRLLRGENDSGTITLLDERIVHKSYGQAILDALPPYRREIFQKLVM